jgi:acyl-CoA thioesterase
MLFSETLASMQAVDKGWSAVIGEDWSQGRGAFGGIVAALGNEAMRRLVPADRQLRGLETVFVGPAFPGTVRMQAEILRVGKAVTIACARMWSADQVAATLTGIYGAPRITEISLAPETDAAVRAAQDLQDIVFPPGRSAPAFVQHFGMRFAAGSRPFAGLKSRRSIAYIRHKDTAALTESHVVALIDCIPSPLMQMMTKPAVSNSLTWTLQFQRHEYAFAPDAWWRIDTDVDSAGGGYACETSVVLNPAGSPAALSRQLVVVFG